MDKILEGDFDNNNVNDEFFNTPSAIILHPTAVEQYRGRENNSSEILTQITTEQELDLA